MMLITSCHYLAVTMATICSHPLHTALYVPALSPGRSGDVIVHPRQPRMNLREDLLQDHQPLRTTVIHLTPQPWASEICIHAHTPTSCDRTYAQTHTHAFRKHTHSLTGGYLVKNRTWMFWGNSEFRGGTSSSVSPQGHSPQAAAAAAITALHLPAPFN